MRSIITTLIVAILSTSALNAQNNALTFNGTDDYVSFTNSPSYPSNIFTIEAWIKITNADIKEDANDIVCWGKTGGNDNVQFRTSYGKLSFGTHPDGGSWDSCESSADLNPGEWTHVAVVKNGTAVQLYINGVKDGSDTNNHTVDVDYMLIGKYSNDEYYFDGEMDEIRIWNDVRTESEIRQNMYQELSDPVGESNLVAYYTFNETSGTTLTDSKGSYNGALTNMAGSEWETSPAMFGPKNCLDFDGSDDYVTLPSSLYSNNFSGGSAITIEYWFKGTMLTSAVRFQYTGYVVAGWGRQFIISTDGGTEGLVIGTSEEIEDGNWHHIACVWEANTTNGFRTYLDGVLTNQRTSENTTLPEIISGAWLGSYNGTEWINGSLDEVRIWNTARTGSEIREDMCKTLTGNENGLVAYYSFDNTSGTTLQDFSGNSYDGTLTNMDEASDWAASSAFNTWLNTSSSDWSTASNWSYGSVPGSSDNVGIYGWSSGSEVNISGSPAVNSLLISSTSSPTLSSGITVNESLILEKDMDLNGQTVTLGSSATLVEDAGAFSGTSGSITTTRNLSGINEDIAGLGATITTSANMGSTTITRSHASASGSNLTTSILRQYAITPTTNTGLDATLEFNYLDDELNSLTEDNIQLVKSEDSGILWSEEGGSVSTGDNTVTLSGIDGFSIWTLAESVTQSINNYALDFDGTDDYVTLPSSLYADNLSGGTAITIEYWFKGTVFSSTVRFQDNAGFIVPGWGFKFIVSTDGDIDGVRIGTAEEIQDGNWHHIACVWEANTENGFRTYLDGVLKNQRTSENTTLPTISSGAWLGAFNEGECLNGSLDEVRIWNTARTGIEIRENMTRTLDDGESGLVAYYKLNETSGTTAYDATANGYDGTLTNMDGTTDWADSEAFTTWLGGTSSDWSTAANWTDGVPTSTDNVGIYKWDGNNEATISGTPEVNSMVISSTSSPSLSSGITVNESLILEKDMDLSGQVVTLDSSATLVEDAGAFSGTSGSITTTRDLDGGIDEDVAGLGATITTAENMGSTTITRSHASASGNVPSSVLRQYAITPTTNTGLDATLVFNYLDDELNDLTEADLQLVKSEDGGATWSEEGGTVSTEDNTVTLSGIDRFSIWTLADSVVPVIQPTINNALDFDGTDDYVNLPSSLYSDNLSGGTAITIEYWFKGTYLNPGVMFNSSDYKYVVLAGRDLQFVVYNDDGGAAVLTIGTSDEIYDGNWHHIACVWEANKTNGFRTYLDGVLKNQMASADVTLPSSIDCANIGAFTTLEFISGNLDEVRIWNTARTASEVRENMCRTLDDDESGLVAYYRLNETSGNTAYDATDNGYDGTLTNMDGSTDWVDSEAFTTWLGGTSSDWATAANWTDGVPTSSDNVGIYKWDGNNEATISGTPEVNNFVISSTSAPTLSSGITVNGSLFLEKDMDLNGQIVTLGSSATLVEGAGVFSGTTGSITTTRDLSNIYEDVAGLGATITTSADMGSTTITRSHAEAGGNISSSILRQYAITPSTNTGLDATLEFNYLDSELNSLNEIKLQLVKSTNGGTTWSPQGGAVSPTDNTITLSGIDGFSAWTANEFIQPTNNNALELDGAPDADGTLDYVALPSTLYSDNLSGGTAITIEYWFKGTNLSPGVAFYSSDLNDYVLAGWGARRFVISNDGGSTGVTIGAGITAAEIYDGNWHHIACVWEANTTNGFRTYLDGVLTNQRTSADVTLPSSIDCVRLGSYGYTDYLSGILDEVRIWNTARTSTQIRENMARTLDGDESGLVAYYRLNEASGTTTFDATGNGYNGTIIDGAWTDTVAFTTWLGGTSSDWSTAANWTNGVPTAGDNVGIYNWGNGSEVSISGAHSVNDIVLAEGTALTTETGSSLEVTENVIIQSNAVFAAKGTTTISGTSIVELPLTGTGTGGDTPDGRGWYVSSPISDATSSMFGDFEDSENGNGLWYYNETTPGYVEIADNETNLSVGTGYIFRTGTNNTIEFSGTLNTGDMTLSPSRTGSTDTLRGFNLIGNPYPAYLDWDALYGASTNMRPTIWYRTSDASGNMVFDTYNTNSGEGTSNNWYGSAVTGLIPPCQAVWVKVDADDSNGSLPMATSMLSAGNGETGLKAASTKEVIRLKAVKGSGSDEAIIVFLPEAGNSYDTYDSEKQFVDASGLPQLYSIAGSTKAVINGLSLHGAPEEIQLGISLQESGECKLEFTEMNTGTTYYLYDKTANTKELIYEGYTYTFTSEAGYISDRFVLQANYTGVDDVLQQTEVKVYGSKDNLVVNTSVGGRLTVTDLLGRKVYMDNIGAGETALPLKTASFGKVYIVRLETGSEVITRKVVL